MVTPRPKAERGARGSSGPLALEGSVGATWPRISDATLTVPPLRVVVSCLLTCI